MLRERLTAVRSALTGMSETVRQGHLPARALAIGDSRGLVRALFLASAVRADLLPYLRTERSLDELIARHRVPETRSSASVARGGCRPR